MIMRSPDLPAPRRVLHGPGGPACLGAPAPRSGRSGLHGSPARGTALVEVLIALSIMGLAAIAAIPSLHAVARAAGRAAGRASAALAAQQVLVEEAGDVRPGETRTETVSLAGRTHRVLLVGETGGPASVRVRARSTVGDGSATVEVVTLYPLP